jgi:hypothetical protein
MANTIAKAEGFDKVRVKEAHRLGSEAAKVQANTWHTFVTAYVEKDGQGYVRVERDGMVLHSFDFGPEGAHAGDAK